MNETVKTNGYAGIAVPTAQRTVPWKLNLGCGDDLRSGYTNLDIAPCEPKYGKIDVTLDCTRIYEFYKPNTMDEILANHLIEHFDFKEGANLLGQCYNILKPGGKLVIETPDMLESCRKFCDADEEGRINLYAHFFSQPWRGTNFIHKFLYTEVQLFWTLKNCGFKTMARVPADSHYALSVPEHMRYIFLKVEAVK